jgi:ectoine hydroxylase-related dioxygenase (phytanoyl-CoA dioxygenase family)
MFLDHNQISHFQRVGFLRVEQVFDQTYVDFLKEKINWHIHNRIHPFVEDGGRIFRLNNLFDRDPCFKDCLTDQKLLNILSSLLGPNIEFVKNRHNHATVNSSQDTKERLHRDILQWSRNIVSLIIYLDDSTEASGATKIIPGSQYLPYVGTPNNGGTWMDEHHVFASLIDQAVSIPVKSGGVLVFNSLAFHTVGKNITNETRRSIAAGYTSVDELLTVENITQREIVLGERLYRGSELNWSR